MHVDCLDVSPWWGVVYCFVCLFVSFHSVFKAIGIHIGSRVLSSCGMPL